MNNSVEQLIIDRTKLLSKQLIAKRGSTPPFGARDYAELMGIKQIVQEDIGEASGMLLKYHSGSVIQVNSKDNSARQNFSIAHELGHLIVSEVIDNGVSNEIEYRSPSGKNGIERLCNMAATEMLMPEEIFLDCLNNLGISINSVSILSNIFKVSLESTIIRISELSKVNVVAICWKYFKTPKGEYLRLAWNSIPKVLDNRFNYKPVSAIIGQNEKTFLAYTSGETVKTRKEFYLKHLKKSCPVESKGFGFGNNRRVLSLAFIS